MARYTISPGIGIDDIETDDKAYADHVMAHYRKQGLIPLFSDDEDEDDLDDYETDLDSYLRHSSVAG